MTKVWLGHAPLTLVSLRETPGGRGHAKRMADAPPSPWPPGSRWLHALGFLAFTLPGVATLMPMKPPPGQDLRLAETRATQALHARR